MKANLRRKLYMSIGTTVMTACCLTTTTYAWFARNGEAWTDEFEFNMETSTGLAISLDGENFYQNISADMLVEQINNNFKAQGSDKTFLDLKYEGVSLKHDADGKIVYDDNGYPVFVKDGVKPIVDTSRDLTEDTVKTVKFKDGKAIVTYSLNNNDKEFNGATDYTIDENANVILNDSAKTVVGSLAKKVVLRAELQADGAYRVFYTDGSSYKFTTKSMLKDSKNPIKFENEKVYVITEDKDMLAGFVSANSDTKYEHVEADTELGDYVTFDLYFQLLTNDPGQVVNGVVTKPSFELYFNDETTYMRSVETYIKVRNKMTLMDGTVLSGKDKVAVNPVDGIRLGVVNNKKEMVVYEPTLGLGSAAIEGKTDAAHDKTKNAMYTYYNNMFPYEPFTKAAPDGEGYNTINYDADGGFAYGNNCLGTFVYDATKDEYPLIKLTFAIWMEGWDADYFSGIAPSAVRVALGFIKKDIK